MIHAERTMPRLVTTITAVLAMLLLVLGTILMHSTVGHDAHAAASTGSASMAGHTHHDAAAEAAGMAAIGAAPSRAVVLAAASTGPRGGVLAAASTAPRGGVPTLTVLSPAGCGGLCELMCSLLGMACTIVLAVFAWVLLRRRCGGLLHLLARGLSLAAHRARALAPPRPPSLTALQIIRI